jgi:hypothetical protein
MVAKQVAHLRALNAFRVRHQGPDHPDVFKVRQKLKHARAEEYIRKLLTEPPAFTPQQRYHLSQLLRRGRV